jgi:hypothetical protein
MDFFHLLSSGSDEDDYDDSDGGSVPTFEQQIADAEHTANAALATLSSNRLATDDSAAVGNGSAAAAAAAV